MFKFVASFVVTALLMTGSAQAASRWRPAQPVRVPFIEHFTPGLAAGGGSSAEDPGRQVGDPRSGKSWHVHGVCDDVF